MLCFLLCLHFSKSPNNHQMMKEGEGSTWPHVAHCDLAEKLSGVSAVLPRGESQPSASLASGGPSMGHMHTWENKRGNVWFSGFLFCKSFSLFPLGLASTAGGSIMIPPQEPGLSSGSLNNHHFKAIGMGLLTFNTHGHSIPTGVSSG